MQEAGVMVDSHVKAEGSALRCVFQLGRSVRLHRAEGDGWHGIVQNWRIFE
jgi:hypothetical protein